MTDAARREIGVMQQAFRSGTATGEQSACYWAIVYSRAHLTLPRIKEIAPGVLKDLGTPISEADARRGRAAALTIILNGAFGAASSDDGAARQHGH